MSTAGRNSSTGSKVSMLFHRAVGGLFWCWYSRDKLSLGQGGRGEMVLLCRDVLGFSLELGFPLLCS